jgi:hypothetical protein
MLRILTYVTVFALPLFSTTAFVGDKKAAKNVVISQFRAGLRGLVRMRARDTRDLKSPATQRIQLVS